MKATGRLFIMWRSNYFCLPVYLTVCLSVFLSVAFDSSIIGTCHEGSSVDREIYQTELGLLAAVKAVSNNVLSMRIAMTATACRAVKDHR